MVHPSQLRFSLHLTSSCSCLWTLVMGNRIRYSCFFLHFPQSSRLVPVSSLFCALNLTDVQSKKTAFQARSSLRSALTWILADHGRIFWCCLRNHIAAYIRWKSRKRTDHGWRLALASTLPGKRIWRRTGRHHVSCYPWTICRLWKYRSRISVAVMSVSSVS